MSCFLTPSVTSLYICLIYQFLVDCQQPAASLPTLSPQLRRGRASLARSPKFAADLQDDRSVLSGGRLALSPCDPRTCLARPAPPPGT
ncbi:unnamed protein product [Menidia menidia]|uniref:(Atlantic silverside) hypothetical protein n=1 Tax=Menidia menidia TaxID=238744 RepID=A0A8S4BF09_9TELE|nr:unnamed protein product [Menidia menidia]